MNQVKWLTPSMSSHEQECHLIISGPPRAFGPQEDWRDSPLDNRIMDVLGKWEEEFPGRDWDLDIVGVQGEIPTIPVDARELLSEHAELIADMTAEIVNLRNGLKWIASQASWHHWGGAFEPAHMNTLRDMAVRTITSEAQWPDFDRATIDARRAVAKDMEEQGYKLDEAGEIWEIKEDD